jgi:hypothetical protein
MAHHAGSIKGRDLRLEVYRIRYGASRDRPRDVVWLVFSYGKHFIADITVTSSAR